MKSMLREPITAMELEGMTFLVLIFAAVMFFLLRFFSVFWFRFLPFHQIFKGVLLVLEVDVVLGQEAGEFVGESQFSSAPHLGFVEYFRRVTSTHPTYATEMNDSVIDRERLGTVADRTIKAIVPSITKETSSTEDVFPHHPHALLPKPSTCT
jgi:hypothetical protein